MTPFWISDVTTAARQGVTIEARSTGMRRQYLTSFRPAPAATVRDDRAARRRQVGQPDPQVHATTV
jgi:hypothetical protein